MVEEAGAVGAVHNAQPLRELGEVQRLVWPGHKHQACVSKHLFASEYLSGSMKYLQLSVLLLIIIRV